MSRPDPITFGSLAIAPVSKVFTTPWSAVLTTAERICAADQSGCCCRTTAAEPARCGVAIDVPWKNAKQGLPPQKDTGIELSTLTPGAITSGLIRKSTSVGPWLLNPAWKSTLVVRKYSSAALMVDDRLLKPFSAMPALSETI